jgi:hypothetical protein
MIGCRFESCLDRIQYAAVTIPIKKTIEAQTKTAVDGNRFFFVENTSVRSGVLT